MSLYCVVCPAHRARKNKLPVEMASLKISKLKQAKSNKIRSNSSQRKSLDSDGFAKSKAKLSKSRTEKGDEGKGKRKEKDSSESPQKGMKTGEDTQKASSHAEVIQIIENFQKRGRDSLVEVLQQVLPDVDFSLSSVSYNDF